MLLDFLDDLKKKTSKSEFEELLKMVEEDVKFNNITFKKCTSPQYFILACIIGLKIIRNY